MGRIVVCLKIPVAFPEKVHECMNVDKIVVPKRCETFFLFLLCFIFFQLFGVFDA